MCPERLYRFNADWVAAPRCCRATENDDADLAELTAANKDCERCRYCDDTLRLLFDADRANADGVGGEANNKQQ